MPQIEKALADKESASLKAEARMHTDNIRDCKTDVPKLVLLLSRSEKSLKQYIKPLKILLNAKFQKIEKENFIFESTFDQENLLVKLSQKNYKIKVKAKNPKQEDQKEAEDENAKNPTQKQVEKKAENEHSSYQSDID